MGDGFQPHAEPLFVQSLEMKGLLHRTDHPYLAVGLDKLATARPQRA